MTADRAVYKCPKCGYVTHFPKALEMHMKFRKHFAESVPVKTEEHDKPAEIQPSEQVFPADIPDIKDDVAESLETAVTESKTVRKPRRKAAKE